MKRSLCPPLRNIPGLELVAQADDAVVEHGMALGRVGIPMKMPVVPALVVQAVFQLIEKCRKSINRGAIPAGRWIKRGQKHARRAGVGDHVVDLPAHSVELCPRLIKVALVRQLLRPPAGIGNAVFLIHARGAAHGKDR